MIPPFDENGYLPPGIHPAMLDDVAAQFGQEPELRRVQMESLRWLVDLARRAGVARLIINGSFVTDLVEPGFPRDRAAETELLVELPFLETEGPSMNDFQVRASRGQRRCRSAGRTLDVIPGRLQTS